MMISILLLLTFIVPQDTLPPSCDCPIPNTLSPAPVNTDTLSYLKKQENYKQGLTLTLRFLVNDSTNQKIFSWLGDFSYLIGEHSVNNSQYRKEKYGGENPHLKYGAIQDTAKFIAYRARQNYGPRFWPSGVRRAIGTYALCSHQCLTDLYPQNREIFKKYVNVLIALKKFEDIHEIARKKEFVSRQPNSELVGKFLLDVNRIFIGYGAYEEGLKYTKVIKKRFDLPNSVYQQWYNTFNFAIRNDERIPRKYKPKLHEKVIQSFPSIN